MKYSITLFLLLSSSTYHILDLLFLASYHVRLTYLSNLDAPSHFGSLCPSALIPALFLARTLSPTKAWASPFSSCLSSASFSSSAPSMSVSASCHTNFAWCSESLSPAVLSNLCSCCRLTPEKMLEHPDFLLRRFESFHTTGRSSSAEVDAGASAMSSGWRISK